MDTSQKSCHACGTVGSPLMKYSLGKDFFGRPYDRLSPSSDQSPKWYCANCSMHKNLQRDFRDIRAEYDKLNAGQGSALCNHDEFHRATVRLQEITAINLDRVRDLGGGNCVGRSGVNRRDDRGGDGFVVHEVQGKSVADQSPAACFTAALMR